MALRQHNPAAMGPRSGALRQLKEGLGKSARKIQEHDIFKLLSGVPKAYAKQLDELEPEFRPLVNQWYEISSLDHHQFAIGYGNRVGRARKTIEQGNLSEDRPLRDQIE